MTALKSGLSAVTGLTTGTRKTCNDVNRKNKGRGRTMLHHHLPLLQHLTAQCLCALSNSPEEKAKSPLQSRGKRKQGFAGDLSRPAHTTTPEVPISSAGSR